jgi:hypothetical protein
MAVKRLRETLPRFRLDRVARVLEQQDGEKPTEMAVLLNTARDTILDLARAQVVQMEGASDVLQSELFKVVKGQEEKIKDLEAKLNARVATDAAGAVVPKQTANEDIEKNTAAPAATVTGNAAETETLEETSSEGLEDDSERGSNDDGNSDDDSDSSGSSEESDDGNSFEDSDDEETVVVVSNPAQAQKDNA